MSNNDNDIANIKSDKLYQNIANQLDKLKDLSYIIEEDNKIKDENYRDTKPGRLLKSLMDFEKQTNVKISSLIDFKHGLPIACAFKKSFNEEIFNYHSIKIIQTIDNSIKNIFGVAETDLAKHFNLNHEIIKSVPKIESIIISLDNNESIFIKQINNVAFLSVIIPSIAKSEIGFIKLYSKSTLENQIMNILHPEKKEEK